MVKSITIKDLLGGKGGASPDSALEKTYTTFKGMTAEQQIGWIRDNPSEAARIIWYMMGQLEGGL